MSTHYVDLTSSPGAKDDVTCDVAGDISENLHRSELTTLERSDQIAEYAKLAKDKREDERQTAQLAQIEKSKREDGKGHRTEGGDAKAAAIGRRKEIYEALHPETKAEAFKGNRHTGSLVNEKSAFTSATAKATGKSRRNRLAVPSRNRKKRGSKLAPRFTAPKLGTSKSLVLNGRKLVRRPTTR